MSLSAPHSLSKGFTLIELLLVIVLISIITVGVVPYFSTYQRRQALEQAVSQLKSDLRIVQNKALNSVDGKAWGINFGAALPTTSYALFYCNPDSTLYNEYRLSNARCGQGDEEVKTVTPGVSGSIVITETTPVGTQDLVFDVVTHNLINNGNNATADLAVKVAFADDLTIFKWICIELGGAIRETDVGGSCI